MKTKLLTQYSLGLTTIILLISFLFLLSCNKAPEEKALGKIGHPLDGTIVSALPKDTMGIFYWNSSSDAFKTLQASVWGTSDSMFDLTTVSHPAAKDFLQILKNNGIDPQEKGNIENLFSEGVAFVSANSDSKEESLSAGVVIKAKDQALVSKLAESIQKELRSQGRDISPVEISAGKALKFFIELDKDDPESKKELFFGWQKNLAILGSKLTDVENVLSGGQSAVPKALNTDLFQRAVKNFPPEKTQYSFGYIDLMAISKLLTHQNQTPKDLQNITELPVEAIALSLGMNNTPYTQAHILHAGKTEIQKKFFSSIKQSSTAELLTAFDSAPMIFISLDGQTIKNAKETYLQSANSPYAQTIAPQLAFMDDIKRVGIGAKVAPIGQAMLPIPDLMILLETSDPAKLNESLTAVFSGLMPPVGNNSGWKNKNISGLDIKYLLTPMGVGVFMASTQSISIITSSEGQMKTAIDAVKNGKTAFVTSIAKDARFSYAQDASCANLYINFAQVAALLQNLGGLAQTYAGQNPEIQKMLEPKQLDSIRKLGAMVASITAEDGALVLKSSYFTDESKPN